MDFHVLTTNRTGGDDDSPLQFISDEQLAHYRHCEAELAALKAAQRSLPAGTSVGTSDQADEANP